MKFKLTDSFPNLNALLNPVANGTVSRGISIPNILNLLFRSGSFDFENNLLLDKTSNGNDVPLIGGNCVNFINDVTITLSPANIGATVTEVNFSGTTTGVTINGSGHIEIDQSELVSSKLYQIKLSTGDELFLTGGTNLYVFSNPALYGLLGGIEDTDWEWSTQNDYFGNLQNGFSKEGLLFNVVSEDMTTWNKVNFTTPDANTIAYTGALYGSQSYIDFRDILTLNHNYKLKITVWDSTENFTQAQFGMQYATLGGATVTLDDEGEYLSLNGVHYISFIAYGAVNRVSFNMRNDSSTDFTGKNLKFRVEYVKEIDENILIPKSGNTDAVGNILTHPASVNYHNGCEVKLDFSGILGATDREGNPLVLPSSYTFGDNLLNPQFKRVKYNDSIKELEGEYLVYNSFQTGSILSSILSYLEEANMLVKINSDGTLLVIQKLDSTHDQLIVFDTNGYNERFTFSETDILDNSNQLPVPFEFSTLGNFTDKLGPYNISVISWSGGTHTSPSDTSIQPDWEEITAVSDANDTITIGDVTDFPLPPTGKRRLVDSMVWGGSAYSAATRNYYELDGLTLDLGRLIRDGGIDLSAVVPGAPNPPYAAYVFKTLNPVSINKGGALTSWKAVKSITIDVIDNILDYTLINKADLTGGEMIIEHTVLTVNQKSPTVFVNLESEFVLERTINTYYGLQYDNQGFDGGKVYFAHGQDDTLQDKSDQDSGARATYESEKYIMVSDVTDNDASNNIALFMNLGYGSPLINENTNPYWTTPSKSYFNMITNKTKEVGNLVQWKGGYNFFKNIATTQYVLAYYQYEDGNMYFIVDFTGSLTFAPSINEVFIQLAGRKVEVTYKDSDITILNSPSSPFTIPNEGLDLTSIAAGNIKLKLL